MVVGETLDLTATAYDAKGSRLSGRAVRWSSRDPEVATVSGDGRVEALQPGRSWIRAEVEEAADSTTVTVLPPIGELTITPRSAYLALDDTLRFGVRVIDGEGRMVTDPAVTWSSGDPVVATVSADGTVTAVGLGQSAVVAKAESLVDTAFVTVVPPLFVAVSAGHGHSCGITTAGVAYCWGANWAGQLGIGDTTGSAFPARVGTGERYGTISAGLGYTCGVTRGGRAYCWGDNKMMELGNPAVTPNSPAPVSVAGDREFVSVSTSEMSHSCALTPDGVAYCWGYNRFGQVGNGSTANEPTPFPVLGGLAFLTLRSGYMRSCGIAADGAVYCWGRGGYAQIGDPAATLETCSGLPCSTIPRRLQSSLSFSSVSTGAMHSCAVTAAGEALCWGWNEEGQLGNGTRDSVVTPTPVAGGLAFLEVSAGQGHSCGLAGDGAGYCWGHNEDGRLGTGTTAPSMVPVPVAGGIALRSISAGASHTCGVAVDGSLYCWGDNAEGQLGDGTREPRLEPVSLAWRRE